MHYAIFRTFLAVLFGLVLTATGVWAAAAQEEPAAATEKEMVMDPTTGKMVTAPVYGGTLTYPHNRVSTNVDPFAVGFEAGWLIDGVNEKLAHGNWGLDREEFAFKAMYLPLFAYTGNLAESWETPDDTTYVFNIRKGVHYALNLDSEASRLVNGRELTAKDVEHSFHRLLGLGSGFTEPSPRPATLIAIPFESITATDKWTVVVKLTEPSVGALRTIIAAAELWTLPAEVIEKYGDYSDWKNVVGTGPFMLTDYVEGVSKTFAKNPEYWGYDEKYPENRLPYIDQLRALLMADEATRISALRTGKVDIIQHAGVVDIRSVDVGRSLMKTDPEIEVHSHFERSFQSITMNIRKPPFDDIRVRHALQMALDLETINDTYYGGLAKWEPIGLGGVQGYYTPFEEWPEDLKQYYKYDPAGAEALLDAAGYPRGADGVRFQTNLELRPGDLGYFEIAAGYFADIGVDVSISNVDPATWIASRGEHNYEMSLGDMAFPGNPVWAVGIYRENNVWLREWVGGVETPELTAAYDALYAATTVEEQRKAIRQFDMEVVKQHNQIWGPLAPGFQANQPWVEGYHGEFTMGDMLHHTILARIWIDQDLKREMGF